MKHNVGSIDRIVRYVIALILVITGLFIGPATGVSIVLYVFAGVLAATATVRFCGIYTLFGLSTCPRTQSK